MDLERNSLEEVIVATVIVLVYSVRALRNLHEISVDVSQGALSYYYIPMGMSGLLFILFGPTWWASILFALGALLLGLLASAWSGLFKLMPAFPLFSRSLMWSLPLYPVAGIIGYYLFSPWGDQHWWPLILFWCAPLFLILISYYELRYHYPPDHR